MVVSLTSFLEEEQCEPQHHHVDCVFKEIVSGFSASEGVDLVFKVRPSNMPPVHFLPHFVVFLELKIYTNI